MIKNANTPISRQNFAKRETSPAKKQERSRPKASKNVQGLAKTKSIFVKTEMTNKYISRQTPTNQRCSQEIMKSSGNRHHLLCQMPHRKSSLARISCDNFTFFASQTKSIMFRGITMQQNLHVSENQQFPRDKAHMLCEC